MNKQPPIPNKKKGLSCGSCFAIVVLMPIGLFGLLFIFAGYSVITEESRFEKSISDMPEQARKEAIDARIKKKRRDSEARAIRREESARKREEFARKKELAKKEKEETKKLEKAEYYELRAHQEAYVYAQIYVKKNLKSPREVDPSSWTVV